MSSRSRPNLKRPTTGRFKRIALLLESDMSFDRAIARGVGEFIRSNKGWVVFMDPMTQPSPDSLRHWQPDGVITSIHLDRISDIAGLDSLPMVGFGSYSEEVDGNLHFPIVTSHQQEIGRMAARHFMSKGLRNFAFCAGDEDALWCRQRLEGFQEELTKKNYTCSSFIRDRHGAQNMPETMGSLGAWLDNLPKPCGVFVFFDGWARWVLDACALREIKVPQEVAVLGVDNDRWLCELSQPRLSSVDPNVLNAGYSAANLLSRLIDGDTEVPPLTYIDPAEVVERESSDYMDFDDPEVAIAMRYIREHACDPITPSDVLHVTGMSSSTAYRKFMKTIGRSIHGEIQTVQMDRVKKLLTTTNLNVTVIGQQAGFENTRYLTKVFRDTTGFSPTEYRRAHSTPGVVLQAD